MSTNYYIHARQCTQCGCEKMKPIHVCSLWAAGDGRLGCTLNMIGPYEHSEMLKQRFATYGAPMPWWHEDDSCSRFWLHVLRNIPDGFVLRDESGEEYDPLILTYEISAAKVVKTLNGEWS